MILCENIISKRRYFIITLLFHYVAVAPVMSSTPKTLEKTWNGNPVNLTCIALAIPNASISWIYNGQKIQNDDIYTIYSRTAHSNLQVCFVIYGLVIYVYPGLVKFYWFP